jgi:hypothetical protein
MSSLTCTFADPKVLDSSGDLIDPTDDSLPFQFSTSDCEGTLDSTGSAVLSQDFYDSVGDTILVFWLAFVFIGFAIFFFIGNNLYRR